VLVASLVICKTATDIEKPTSPDSLPFAVTITSNFPEPYPSANVPKGAFLYSGMRSVYGFDGGPDIQHPVLVYYDYFYPHYVCFFGAASIVKQFINDYNAEMQKFLQAWLAGSSLGSPGFDNQQTAKLVPTAFIPLEPEPDGPFLPTGNKPPMKDCCEDVLDALEDIKEALGIERILKDKFPVANTFMAPECSPGSTTVAKNFYEVLQCVFRTLAHGLIFEPKVKIKDADAAKAGDQEFKTKYLNATGWASAVSEALMEAKDDGNVGTNMDIRNGFAVTQMMVGVADAHYKLDTLLDCLGIKLAHETQTVETPYNLMIQLGKGFGENNERQIDLNQDEATEALLPQLLQTKKNKIKTVMIHPRSRNLLEVLENIEQSLSR
jgi:hypothetical protein